jgi:hypothetical protein
MTGGTTTGGVTTLSGTTAGLAGMFVGAAGTVFCAATPTGAPTNSANAHTTCNIRMPAFNFMELALNPQDTATHRISGILANNSDEFDVNFAAIGKNNLGQQ